MGEYKCEIWDFASPDIDILDHIIDEIMKLTNKKNYVLQNYKIKSKVVVDQKLLSSKLDESYSLYNGLCKFSSRFLSPSSSSIPLNFRTA